MYNRPEIQPLAVCSASSFASVSRTDDESVVRDSTSSSHVESQHATVAESEVRSGRERASEVLSDVSNKQAKPSARQQLSKADKRHKENLERKDRFLDLFQQLVEKL
jgi:hypothetical protein